MAPIILDAARRAYASFSGAATVPKPACIQNPDSASERIRTLLDDSRPAMIARFGSNELACVVNYLGVRSRSGSWLDYVRGRALPWWWKAGVIEQMQQCAGFFPPHEVEVERFCELMLRDMPSVDLLGSWLPIERFVDDILEDCCRVDLELLNPYFAVQPWTHALRGRKVLVIHPFARSIENQYRKRECLFANGLLPAFELKTIKAVQSSAGEKTPFSDWFEALDLMKVAMDRTDYDIALIGCGAYGFPLAAHAKRNGKKGFHLGGSLQLLFGIRGKRWESSDYNPIYNYSRLMNEHWIKAAEEERPQGAEMVEDACYW